MSLVLLTGASRGIGRATALYLAEQGVELILLGRASVEQRQTENILADRRTRFASYTCDFFERESVDRALSEILEKGEIPDALIHNAAIIERASVLETTDESWDRQMEVNLRAPLRVTRALLPPMLQRKSGRIVFVSSISAVLGSKNQSAYHASKAGLLGAMRCLAEELSDTGLSTTALLPGAVDTQMLQGSAFPPRMSPQDVAKTLAFYALEAPTAHNGGIVELFGT